MCILDSLVHFKYVCTTIKDTKKIVIMMKFNTIPRISFNIEEQRIFGLKKMCPGDEPKFTEHLSRVEKQKLNFIV